jgi:uncharacterized repeat protein (TIGR03833 family)
MIVGKQRKNVQIGLFAEIIQKKNQVSAALMPGIISKLLTRSMSHPHGIKV